MVEGNTGTLGDPLHFLDQLLAVRQGLHALCEPAEEIGPSIAHGDRPTPTAFVVEVLLDLFTQLLAVLQSAFVRRPTRFDELEFPSVGNVYSRQATKSQDDSAHFGFPQVNHELIASPRENVKREASRMSFNRWEGLGEGALARARG